MMSELVLSGGFALDIPTIEKAMLALPQAECEVFHFFAPGLYVRGVHLPPGILAVGHRQKTPHLNIMIRGKVVMLEGGNATPLEAPQIFVGQPIKKIGYILEDTLWLNVYATEETDIAKLEEAYLEKSDASIEDTESKIAADECFYEACRADYKNVLAEFGFTAEEARNQSENTTDQIPMPENSRPIFAVQKSPIEGSGVFATATIGDDQIIGIARLDGKRTPLGRYVNHSVKPNAEYIRRGDDIYLRSVEKIAGCMGGSKGTEITVSYRQALALSGLKGEKN